MIHLKIPLFKYRTELVLEGIDIRFETGKTHGVVGLNGAGKTTMFQIMAGFLKTPGAAVTRNENAVATSEVAYLDTDLFFYPKLTAREFLSVFPSKSASYHEEALAALLKLPLDGFMEEFSTGMKKKLLLQSQIKQNKNIYILDEPFNGLDLETNRLLEVIISLLNERGKTVFISSHILEPLLNVCTQVHYLKNKGIERSFRQEEFSLIEEELFGNYTREIRKDLLHCI